MKLKDLFFGLFVIPLFVPLLDNSVFAFWNSDCWTASYQRTCLPVSDITYVSARNLWVQNVSFYVDSNSNFHLEDTYPAFIISHNQITQRVFWYYFDTDHILNYVHTTYYRWWWAIEHKLVSTVNKVSYTWSYSSFAINWYCNNNNCQTITYEEFSELPLWWQLTDYSYYNQCQQANFDDCFSLCLWYANLWYSICISNKLTTGWVSLSTWNMVYPPLIDNLVQFASFWNSPFVWWWWWSSWWNLVELESPYLVSDIIYAYWDKWYTNWLCYWNFAINDLAVSWSIDQFFDYDLDDWVYFTWANIIDLYKAYSWNNSFSVFFNSWFARFYPSYTNNTSLWFIWFPKALWYNQYLVYIHRSTIKDFSYDNLFNYCSLAIAVDKWSISLDDNFNIEMINNWSLPTSVEEELTDSNNSVLVPWEDSIFNWSWFVPWSWWVWWWWRSRGEWDEPFDAYWLFSRLYDYISWLSENFDLWLTTKWVLPSIIQFWFLFALLYYILKR